MNRLQIGFSMLCVLPLLQSCAHHEMTARSQWELAPLYNVKHATGQGQVATRSAASYHQLGRYYQTQGRHEQARVAFAQALNLDASQAETHNALGSSLAALGHLDQALEAFASAIRLAPEVAHYRNNQGYALYLQGRHNQAVAAFEDALRIDPTARRSWNNLGMALARAGEAENSRQAFARAAELGVLVATATPAAAATAAVVATPAVAATPVVAAPAVVATPAVAVAPTVAATPVDKSGPLAATPVASVPPAAPVQPRVAVAVAAPVQPAAPVQKVAAVQAVAPVTAALGVPPAAQPAVTAALTPTPAPGVAARPAPAASPKLAAGEALEFLAVPKDRGVIAPVPQQLKEQLALSRQQAEEAAWQLTQAQLSEREAAALQGQPLNTPPAGTDEAAPLQLVVLSAQGGKATQHPATSALTQLASAAPLELRQLAPQVFELHMTAPAGALQMPGPVLTADLPTRFQEYTQLTATADRLLPVGVSAWHPAQQPGAAWQVAWRQPLAVSLQHEPATMQLAHAEVSVQPQGSQATPSAQAAWPGKMRFFRLELANGVGIKRFARSVGTLLAASGVPSAVLTDQRPFRQLRTEIQYRPGYDAVARALSQRIPVPSVLHKSSALPGNMDVRVVLGRDLVRQFALNERNAKGLLISEADWYNVLARLSHTS